MQGIQQHTVIVNKLEKRSRIRENILRSARMTTTLGCHLTRRKALWFLSLLTIIAVLPYASHGFADRWDNLHKIVQACANQVVIVSPDYTPDCYHQRNRYMIENSSHLIYYWDGQSGGTAQTVRMAKHRDHTFQNTTNMNNL